MPVLTSFPDEQPNSVPTNVAVSVCMTTYNHERYIAQAIEGVLMQKTDFPFELCIGEDGSSDETRQICKEYAAKYPSRIRLFLRKSEDKIYIDGRMTGKYNVAQLRHDARGNYLAVCEGDDFWIDSDKLKKQFDYMEQNATILLSGARCLLVDWEARQTTPRIFPRNTNVELVPYQGVLELAGLPHTSTLFMRRDVLDVLPAWGSSVIQGDLFLLISIAHQSGLIGVLPDVVSVYRVHAGGIMRGKQQARRLEVELSFWRAFLQYAEEQNDALGIKYANLYICSKKLALVPSRNVYFWMKKLYLYFKAPFLLKRWLEFRLLDRIR